MSLDLTALSRLASMSELLKKAQQVKCPTSTDTAKKDAQILLHDSGQGGSGSSMSSRNSQSPHNEEYENQQRASSKSSEVLDVENENSDTPVEKKESSKPITPDLKLPSINNFDSQAQALAAAVSAGNNNQSVSLPPVMSLQRGSSLPKLSPDVPLKTSPKIDNNPNPNFNLQQTIMALNALRNKNFIHNPNMQSHNLANLPKPNHNRSSTSPYADLPTLSQATTLPSNNPFLAAMPAGMSLQNFNGVENMTVAKKRKRESYSGFLGDKEGKVCLICGDRATGLHYGIISCEGCKGFFKRSICNRRVYRCSRNGTCEMSRKQRNRCQFCRLKKCLEVGMNRKAIREDGMPGGRNKNIGPVTLSQSEVDMVLSGREFDDENMSGNGDHSTNQSGGNGARTGSGIDPPITFPTTVNSFASLPSINSMNNFNKNMHSFNNQNKVQNKPVIPNMTLQQQQTTNYLLNKSGPFFSQHQNINPNQNRGLTGPETLLRAASLANEMETDSIGKESVDSTPDRIYPQAKTLIDDLIRIDSFENLSILRDQPFKNQCEVKKDDMLMFLAKCADEMLVRQTGWIKKLPFYEDLAVKDHITLLTATWFELNLIAGLTVFRNQLLFEGLGNIMLKYAPEPAETLDKPTVETLERLCHLCQRLSRLQIDAKEYSVMKIINFLNQDIQNLDSPATVEEINKTYWYKTQAWIEMRHKIKFNNIPDPTRPIGAPDNGQPQRFRDLMLCLPEIRQVTAALHRIPTPKIPLMLQTLVRTLRMAPGVPKENANSLINAANIIKHNLSVSDESKEKEGSLSPHSPAKRQRPSPERNSSSNISSINGMHIKQENTSSGNSSDPIHISKNNPPQDSHSNNSASSNSLQKPPLKTEILPNHQAFTQLANLVAQHQQQKTS